MSDPSDLQHDRAGRTTILGLRRSEWGIGATSLGLNMLVNGILPERFHLAASLAASGVVTSLAVRAGAGVGEQGLDVRHAPKGIALGVVAATPIVAGVGAGLVIQKSREFYREPRITDATAREAAYHVFVRIPLGTALPEELIFRGAILGLLSRYHRPLVATAISSILFGLWHIAPTLDRIETNPEMAGKPPLEIATRVATSVAATAASGFFLAGLRYRSGSFVAPWIAHSAANASGFAGGWLAARIFRTPDSESSAIAVTVSAS